MFAGTVGIAFAYAKKMYQMDVTEYSNANTIFPSVQAIMTIAITPLLSKKLLLHEAAIGLTGMLSLIAKFTFLSVAYSVPLFYLGESYIYQDSYLYITKKNK